MSSAKVASKRVHFGKVKHLAETPDLLEIQIQSFKDYFQLETTPDKRNNEGLFKVFKENFPINDTRNIFMLEFLDYFIDPPRYTIEECMERGLTYAVPLNIPTERKFILHVSFLSRVHGWNLQPISTT
ncbi:MAG: hypothetical protein LW706_12860 [Chitinophagaceae bacterium]|nr:hypothetical protein [Chitinophagaceae bacterium]